MKRRILLVEDEESLATVVQLGLEEARYAVDVAADGLLGLQLACEREYSAILLDLMLPGMDGWKVCRQLRSRGFRTPILMLTAAAEEADRVRGLDAGADDYLGKPFEFAELLARIRSLVRRDTIYETGVVRAGDLEIDLVERRVRRGRTEVQVSPREFALITALASREGQVLTREFIMGLVWQDGARSPSVLEVYISMVRRKLERADSPRLIHTIPGEGYVLRSAAPVAMP